MKKISTGFDLEHAAGNTNTARKPKKTKALEAIKWVAIDKIRPYEKNAKKHSPAQVEQIAKSIQEFGFNQPLVVDADGVIIVGHGRFEAAKYLEMITVPVLELNLPDDKVKAYRLADNKLNESEWDMTLVINELKELSLELVTLTGFDSDLLIDPDEQDDVVPAVPKVAQSQIGDVYQLGRHVLLCGDSTNPEAVKSLFGTMKADMVFTDPPYNVNYEGVGKKTSNKIMNDKMSGANFKGFLDAVFANYAEHSKAGAAWYVFHASSEQDKFKNAIESTAWHVKQQVIWNKPFGWGMADYRFKHEPIFYCGQPKVNFYGSRSENSVLDLTKTEEELVAWAKRQKRLEAEGKTTIWTMKRETLGEYVHPTQKPVELIGYAMHNSSKAGDIVADLFLGSGATLIAAEKYGRDCYGMELDPRYVDIIVTRYCEYVQYNAIMKNGKKIDWVTK